jgi:hypothetical protein
MDSCPETLNIHGCIHRILVKNRENEAFWNQGTVFPHSFFISAFYKKIKKTFSFLIRVFGRQSMSLAYQPERPLGDVTSHDPKVGVITLIRSGHISLHYVDLFTSSKTHLQWVSTNLETKSC